MQLFFMLKKRGIKYKKILIEFSLNVVAFSLLIISQQLIAFPLISRYTENTTFGQIILIYGIGNIIVSMLGTSIGTARLLDDNKQYNRKYIEILLYSFLIVIIVGYTCYYNLFEKDILQSLIFSFMCILGAIRGFLVSEYRINNSHNWIFKQNFIYFLGLLIGCVSYFFYSNWIVIFLIPEILTVTYCLRFLIKDGFLERFSDKSDLRLANVFHLMFNNGLSYSLNQYDRLVIFPILGAAKVSIYFTVTISSRMGALIMNPLSNFILGKLSNEKGNDKKATKAILLFSIAVMVVYFCLSILMTPIIVKLLYPSFYSHIHALLIPVCLGAAISSGNTILRPVVMKSLGAKLFNKFFICYAIVVVISSIIMGIYFDLVGIALAKIFSSFVFFMILSASLKKSFRQ